MIADAKFLAERFWECVSPDPDSGCWLWTGAHGGSATGKYGRVYYKDKSRWRYQYAHVVSYELHRGPIPEGLEIDHLCRDPNCVNPWHLEPVPHAVNLARGDGAPAVNSRKTHCQRGHEFTEENTMWITTRPGKRDRRCRTCVRAWEREYRPKWRKQREAKQ